MIKKEITRIIFIVGRPRSGTNFVRSVLNLHSKIWISGEPKFFQQGRNKGVIKTISHLYPFNDKTRIDEMFSLLRSGKVIGKYWINPKLNIDKIKSEFERSDREYRDLVRITLKERARVEHKSIFGDKTPDNLHHIPTLMKWFPAAKFLHIIRDPRAVFVSEINRSPNPHYLLRRSNTISRFMIFIYICKDWLNNIRLHKLYQSDYPQNYLFIKFQQLYSEREAEIKRITNFLGVDFEDPMLNPPRRGSSFEKDHDPMDGWQEKIPWGYKFIFDLLLRKKIDKYT